jgi:hypothetical protein
METAASRVQYGYGTKTKYSGSSHNHGRINQQPLGHRRVSSNRNDRMRVLVQQIWPTSSIVRAMGLPSRRVFMTSTHLRLQAAQFKYRRRQQQQPHHRHPLLRHRQLLTPILLYSLIILSLLLHLQTPPRPFQHCRLRHQAASCRICVVTGYSARTAWKWEQIVTAIRTQLSHIWCQKRPCRLGVPSQRLSDILKY